MNILPMIAMILLILALGSAALLQESVSTFWEKRSYLSFMKVERRARNEWEQRQYKKTKTTSGPKAPAIKNNPATKNNLPYVSPREKRKLNDLAKLNIAPLFAKTPASPSYNFLYESTAELIRLLYGQTPLFKESDLAHIEYELLDALIAKGKKNEKIASFAELYPEEPRIKEIFYKIAKGSTSFPPLSDYLLIDREEKERVLYFNYAPKLILTALFGKDAASTIIQEEKTKWQESSKHQSLNKAELTTILQKNRPGSLPLSELDQLLSFSKKRPKERSFMIVDKETGITSRRKV